MNINNVITSLQSGYTTVSVVFNAMSDYNETFDKKFNNPLKRYTYKIRTSSDIKENDLVVVAVSTHDQFEYKVVRVVERHVAPKIDPRADFSYKWVVSKVDMTEYNNLVNIEEQMAQVLKIAEMDRAREAARKALIETYGEDAITMLQSMAEKLLP